MGKQVYVDVRLFVGGADLSGQSNKLETNSEMEVRTGTNFRSGGAREVMAGCETFDMTAEGQYEVGDPSRVDDAAWAAGRVVEPVSFAPDGQSDLAGGSLAYLTQAVRSDFKVLGPLGEIIPWSGTWGGSWPLVRGRCIHPSGVPRGSSGTGTAYQIGQVPQGKHAYATLHVLSVAGTTPGIEVTVQSATDPGGPWTDRHTFAQATEVGGQAARFAAGPVADSHWRVSYTVSGTDPSFLFLVALGIA